MNIGFWSCIILVIPFLIIGVLFAIFKEKAENWEYPKVCVNLQTDVR